MSSSSFFHPLENESRKAAKRKGSWAHQQTDKITPWTIVSLSVVEDVGESDSKLWKDRRVNVIQGSIAGRLENVPGSVETSSCLLNQKHHSTLFILRLLRGSMRAAVWSLKIYIILYYIYICSLKICILSFMFETVALLVLPCRIGELSCVPPDNEEKKNTRATLIINHW
jgi:hypothetical protein